MNSFLILIRNSRITLGDSAGGDGLQHEVGGAITVGAERGGLR